MTEIVRLLNKPLIKEGIKDVAGVVTCAFGIVELYDIYQIMCGREIGGDLDPQAPAWAQVATKVSIFCAKLSLVLSAGVSRPGVFVISTLVGQVFTTPQLEAVFGPNTTFALNPWHPRHVFSIAAAILALPAVLHLMYQGVSWVCREVEQFQDNPQDHWLTDFNVRIMALFNTITSRPMLHVGNRLGHFLF